MLGKKLINAGPVSSGANTFASENFNTVLYTGNGGTQRIGGYINRGAEFNGSSSRINTNYISNLTTASYSFWVNVKSGVNERIISSLSPNPLQDAQIDVVLLTGNIVQFGLIVGGSFVSASASTALSTNTWYHIVLTYSSGGFLKGYINGTEEASLSIGTISSGNNTTALNIGYYPRFSTYELAMNFDQLRIFNKALSSSEVTTLYGETHASSTISTTDIFDDNSGVALYQLDGNANDTGGTSGKFGAGGIFNGSSSKIEVPIDLDDYDETWSISMWVKFDFNSSNRSIAGNVNSSSYNGFVIDQGTSGQLRFRLRNGTTSVSSITSLSNYGDGNWHHIVVVKGSTTNYLYIDGGSETLSIATTNGIIHSSQITFGRLGFYSSSDYFKGTMDDIRIYSDELTPTEVGYIYNNTTASIPTDNLLAYHKLDGDARDEKQLYDGAATNVTYAYDGTATNVTYQEATKFQPDLVWIKNRANGVTDSWHTITDSVRGGGKRLFSNTTHAELSDNYDVLSFQSNGFTIGTGTYVSWNGGSYVAWCFKGGGTAVSNTDGSITSSVSANQDAGFSIVKYTGNGGSGQSVGHGLSSAPEMVIFKRTDAAQNWFVFVKVGGVYKRFEGLNTTAASTSVSYFSASSTSITWSGTTADFNGSGKNYILYNFHSVEGYSKIGSYTGTGVSGNTVETGFEPAFIMIKKSSDTGSWYMFDNERLTLPYSDQLIANSSAAETTGTYVKFLANGFQLDTTASDLNTSSQTFIYLAIAGDPDTTTPTVENSFDIVTYTGDGTTDHKINVDFKPDLVWIGGRSTANYLPIMDSVRGNESIMFTALTGADTTYGSSWWNNYGRVKSFDSDGFTLDYGSGNTSSNFNQNGQTYVAWCWKAGDHDESLPQINTEGSIDSIVSVNAEAGFSIVSYIGTGASATVGHGLSSAPELIIAKNRDAAQSWIINVDVIGKSNILTLPGTSALLSRPNQYYYDWNATTITMASDVHTNGSGNGIIAYCFHSVSGYQDIGSYEGNGSTTGPIVTTGFRPRVLLIKNVDASAHWRIMDSQRDTDTNIEAYLTPGEFSAEASGTDRVTFTNTGFQLVTSATSFNANNNTFIYLAIK